MKAQIFYLDQQQTDLKNSIQERIERYFGPGMLQIQSCPIDPDYRRSSDKEIHKHAEWYMERLKSSIVKSDDFGLVIQKSDEWCYFGLEHDEDTSKFNHVLELGKRQMTQAFPALAVWDRMVLVPPHLNAVLQSMLQSKAIRLLFWPIRFRGVLMVDFTNSKALDAAIRQMAEEVTQEIASLCSSLVMIQKTAKPSLSELSTLLNVSESFLSKHVMPLTEHSVSLNPIIVGESVPAGKSSRVTLDIHNYSEHDLKGLCVTVAAPTLTLQDSVQHSLDLPANSVHSIHFQITPRMHPYCPLEIVISADEMMTARDSDFSRRVLPIPLIFPRILNVLPP